MTVRGIVRPSPIVVQVTTHQSNVGGHIGIRLKNDVIARRVVVIPRVGRGHCFEMHRGVWARYLRIFMRGHRRSALSVFNGRLPVVKGELDVAADIQS
jgi:hypothetical protein